MSELRADPLSPIDAATLWPQLHRLNMEVVAVQSAEHLLVSSGLAATGLSRLPRMPRTAVLGVRQGLRYRGIVVLRELDGGAAWEAVSIRLATGRDDDTLAALLAGASRECAARGARALLLRYPEGSPHAPVLRRAGFTPHTLERLHALPSPTAANAPPGFRPARGRDRSAVFQLYCRAVPEHVRRQEATTLQEWRAVLDSYECSRTFVAEREGAVVAWVGAGDREGRMLLGGSFGGLVPDALDLVESLLGRTGTLVIAEHQPDVEREALGRGYEELGTRLFCSRRLAILNPLKEAAKGPVTETVSYG